MTVAQVGRFAVYARIVSAQDRWHGLLELDRFDLATKAIDWIARMPGVVAVAIRQLDP